jgi:hypothetical protein
MKRLAENSKMHKRVIAIVMWNEFAYINNENRIVISGIGLNGSVQLITTGDRNLEFIEFSSSTFESALAKNNMFVEFRQFDHLMSIRQLDCDAEIVSMTKIENRDYFVSVDGRVFVQNRDFVEDVEGQNKRFVEVQRMTTETTVALLHAGHTVDLEKSTIGDAHYSNVKPTSTVAFDGRHFYSTDDYRIRISGLTINETLNPESPIVKSRIAVLDSPVYIHSMNFIRFAMAAPVFVVFCLSMSLALLLCLIVGVFGLIIGLFAQCLCGLVNPRIMINIGMDLDSLHDSIMTKTGAPFWSLFRVINDLEYTDSNPIIAESMRLHVLESQINRYESTRIISECDMNSRIFLTNDVSKIIIINTYPPDKRLTEFEYEHAQGIQSMVWNDNIAIVCYADRSIRVNRIDRTVHLFSSKIRLLEFQFIPPERVTFANEMTPVL